MSLLGAIHTLWEEREGDEFDALRALLPAARVVTGNWKGDDDLPYGTWNVEADQTLARSNCGRLDNASVRLQVWHENQAAGAAIQKAVIDAFDELDVTVGDEQIVSILKSNAFSFEEEDGVWQFVTDFEIQH